MRINNIFIVVIALSVCVFVIAKVFWEQELQYTLPTPIPSDYVEVSVRQQLNKNILQLNPSAKPKHLHFFNPTCPCSRFNLDHFLDITKRYENQVDFYMVIPSKDYFQELSEKYNKIKILIDEDKTIAKTCGVYSTPQAVILEGNDKLYYRGNYNKSRYCTEPNSNFAQIALDALVDGKKAPAFGELSTTSYGCQLNKTNSFFSF
jgi:hypothetical protein